MSNTVVAVVDEDVVVSAVVAGVSDASVEDVWRSFAVMTRRNSCGPCCCCCGDLSEMVEG